jgi:hypothetical protein
VRHLRLPRLQVAEPVHDRRELLVLDEVVRDDPVRCCEEDILPQLLLLVGVVVLLDEALRLLQVGLDVDVPRIEPADQLVHQHGAGVVLFRHILPLTRVCNRYDGLFHGKRNMPVAARQLTHRTKIYSV